MQHTFEVERNSLRTFPPSIETHLSAVRGLPTKNVLLKCVNEKSSDRQTNRSSEQCQVLIQQ